MLKAGALYLSIIVAFLIAVICASLIMLAVHYKSAYLKELRFDRLILNLDSAVELALEDTDLIDPSELIDLYDQHSDSILIDKKHWGMFGLVNTTAFISKDTLKRSFLIGYADTSDKVVLYVKDENRPLSLSGETRITGEVFLPKSGVKKAFVETRRYSGDKLIYGQIRNSEEELPPLQKTIIEAVSRKINDNSGRQAYVAEDQENSFYNPVKILSIQPQTHLMHAISGNIILVCDGALILEASAKLDGVQVYAAYIKVERGFSGNCQLFARDSVVVGDQAQFLYPSGIAIIQPDSARSVSKISIGKDLSFQGYMLSYLKKTAALRPQITLGKNARISGEIYSDGPMLIEPGLELNGKLTCERFLMKTASSIYENVLLDVKFNRKSRSQYYLSPGVITGAMLEKKILKWLN